MVHHFFVPSSPETEFHHNHCNQREENTVSYEEAVDKLMDLLREKAELGKIAAGKIKQITSELETCPPFDRKNIEQIKAGFIYFKEEKFEKNRSYFAELAEGQHPKFLVFSCSDARVSPSHILNFQPGDAFMSRNIGNIVPPFDKTLQSGMGAASAIEYAVTDLKVEDIVIMGHSRCGGIKALMSIPEDETPTTITENWVSLLSSAKEKVIAEYGDLSFEEQCSICEKEGVNVSLANLLTYPYVREGLVNNTLALHGAHYNFVDGTFEMWDLDLKLFPSLALS